MVDFEKAKESAERRQTDEEVAFRRAVTAGKMKMSLLVHEQEMLESFPPEQRAGVMAFVRWCEGQKFDGGMRAKLIAKAAFVQGFQIAEAVHEVGAYAKKEGA